MESLAALARLGTVIYLLGWIIAIQVGLYAAGMFLFWYMNTSIPQADALNNWMLAGALIGTGISFGSWLIGRVALYVLAGR